MLSMRLIHYSADPLTEVRSVDLKERGAGAYKPRGLWVSVEGDDDWLNWCKSESYGAPEKFAHATEVLLRESANVLRLTTPLEIDDFTRLFGYAKGDALRRWERGID